MPYKDEEKQKAAVRQLRKKHHSRQVKELRRARLDCYVEEETKEGMGDIKMDKKLRTEGSVVDFLFKFFMDKTKSKKK